MKTASFIRRDAAEKIGKRYANELEDVALIVVADPGCEPYDVNDRVWREVLHTRFHDILSDVGQYKAISEAQAREIVRFILRNLDARAFVAACDAGISRSAAIATFAAEVSGAILKGNASGKNGAVLEILRKLYKKELNGMRALAEKIASAAHAGQTDKGGAPYIDHPKRVAAQLPDLDAQIVALLHDVIEDAGYTPEFLSGQGFTDRIVDAVVTLSRREGESYQNFILRAGANPLARRVKIADLIDNLDLSRITSPTEKDLKRTEKYRKALAELE